MIQDLKDFERLIKFCRKQGIDELTLQGITVKFGELPSKVDLAAQEDSVSEDLTPEQLMYLAVNGR